MKKTIYDKTRQMRYWIIDTVMKLLAPNLGLMRRPRNVVRPMIAEVKRRFGDQSLTGIEIGVWAGENAENMLKVLKIKKLYLIDPYIPYALHSDPVHMRKPMQVLAEAKQRAERENTEFIIKKSVDAVNDVPEVDFIYIDGDHSYEAVKQDIELYYPKARLAIGGHNFQGEHLGLCRAVIEFAQNNNLNLKLRAQTPDWWIIKAE